MFLNRRYVPVLRWKGSERKALLKIASLYQGDESPD